MNEGLRAALRRRAVAEAQKAVALVAGEAKKLPTRATIQLSAQMFSDAVTALDKKDAKGPAALLAKCPPDDTSWKLRDPARADAVGDKATPPTSSARTCPPAR